MLWPTSVFRLLVAAAATLASAMQAPAQERPATPRSALHSLDSDAVGDRFQILVTVPEGYADGDGEATYPFLYILDAEKSFGLASDVADWLSWAGEVLAGENHISALPAALARGLKWIFVP